jgi:hypothetical protein
VKNAVRQFSQETAQARTRRVPSTTSTSATVIQLSAVSGGGPAKSAGKPATAGKPTPARRGSRGGDLILGGGLALLLLVACLTWEVLSQGHDAPHATPQSDHRTFIQAAH